MPVQFLSQADRDRLNRFPEEINREELNSFFWLSPTDRQAIDSIRGDYNRLGFALQLGCLRYLGFFPENLWQTPQIVIQYVAQQLEVVPELLAFYGKRTSTQRQHQRQIQKLLGYRRATTADIVELEQWLLQRASLARQADIAVYNGLRIPQAEQDRSYRHDPIGTQGV